MLGKIWDNMFEGGSLWAGLITGGVAQVQDTLALSNKRLTTDAYAVNSTKNVSMALGTMAGVEAGAVLGTAIMPGFGTMIGSIVGGMAGDRVGTYVGTQAGTIMFRNPGTGEAAAGNVPATQATVG